jgi:hypothetical protein
VTAASIVELVFSFSVGVVGIVGFAIIAILKL